MIFIMFRVSPFSSDLPFKMKLSKNFFNFNTPNTQRLKMKNTLIQILKKVAIALAGLLLLLAVLIGIVFQFVLTPEKITPKVVSALNQNLDADLSLGSVELTFFKTFPSFKLELEEGFILKPMDSLDDPKTSYRQDTLMAFEYAVADVNPIAFLRDKIRVNRFSFIRPRIYALVTPEGEVNWDILKEPDSIKVELETNHTQHWQPPALPRLIPGQRLIRPW